MRRLRRDDEGVAMIVVVTLGAIILLLVTVIFTRSVSDQNQVSGQRLFEQAIHVSEAGVEDALVRIQDDPTWNSADSALPVFSSAAEEEAFVRSQVDDNPVTTTGPGQWAVYKPANAQVVFSVGWAPSKANPTRSRLVRIEYDFLPGDPIAAIISNNDIKFRGSVEVTGTMGSVHANDDLSIIGGGSYFNGSVTAVDDANGYTAGNTGEFALSGGDKPIKNLPIIDPLKYHRDGKLVEYELCPDGTVRAGPNFGGPIPVGRLKSTAGNPCAGTAVLGDTSAGQYRGWAYKAAKGDDPPQWQYNGGTVDPVSKLKTDFDGAYFAFGGNILVGGNPGSADKAWVATLVASQGPTSNTDPSHDTHCGGNGHSAGDVKFTGTPFIKAFQDENLLIIAGRDVELSGVGTSGFNYQGFVGVHEQFDGAGTFSLYGSITINDLCDTVIKPKNSPVRQYEATSGGPGGISGNFKVTYNGELNPLFEDLTITRWQEV